MENQHPPSDFHTRLVILETQMGRLLSDYESEKRTRADSHGLIRSEIKEVNLQFKQEVDDLKDHLTAQDKTLNRFIGALVVINLLVPVALKFFFK